MDDLWNIAQKTLLQGDGYITVLKGLWITVQITTLSLFLGTVLGALICALRVCKYKVLQWVARVYIALLRGSPVLLLLMLMYYVVFASTQLSATFIAVTAFSLNLSAHVAELMRAALLSTDFKQNEAARTLGFSRFQAFYLITLPQASKIAKPVYQSNIVNLIQWTSVVGYVTITDLTRVINNMSARTMEPLFMILVGMGLYLGLAYVCYGIFALWDMVSEMRMKRRGVQND